jgi:hypothetical protein
LSLNWLFPQYQQNLLRVLFENPTSRLHISELARRADIDSGNAKRYLEKFAKKKLVTLNKTSKMTFVSPNFSSPEIAKIFEFYEVDRRQSFLGRNQSYCANLSTLTDILISKIDGIQLISLFGPSTYVDEQGRSNHNSGLDMVVVVSNGFHSEPLKNQVEEIIKEIYPPIEVSPLVIGTKDFEAGWKRRDSFYANLWRERIVLHGESYFWKHVAEMGVPE